MHQIIWNLGLNDLKNASSNKSLKHDTADARQRIVSERVDLVDNLILSVSVFF